MYNYQHGYRLDNLFTYLSFEFQHDKQVCDDKVNLNEQKKVTDYKIKWYFVFMFML